MDWRTGTQKAAVYRVPAHPDDGKLTVMATTLEKSMPRVTPEHEAAVLRFYDARKQRAEASRRRIVGGDGGDDNEDGRPAQLDRFEAFHRGQRKMLRYPEVHGLRFVHEAGIHQNRDLASSQSISRLCVLKIRQQSCRGAFGASPRENGRRSSASSSGRLGRLPLSRSTRRRGPRRRQAKNMPSLNRVFDGTRTIGTRESLVR